MFDVQIEKSLSLITIRHYNEQIIKDLLNDKHILLQQKTSETIQTVCRN